MKTYRITYHTSDGKAYEVIQDNEKIHNFTECKYIQIKTGLFSCVIIAVDNLCAVTIELFQQ